MNNNGTIVNIHEIINDNEVHLGYQVIIEFKAMPDLMLGNCWVKQYSYRRDKYGIKTNK